MNVHVSCLPDNLARQSTNVWGGGVKFINMPTSNALAERSEFLVGRCARRTRVLAHKRPVHRIMFTYARNCRCTRVLCLHSIIYSRESWIVHANRKYAVYVVCIACVCVWGCATFVIACIIHDSLCTQHDDDALGRGLCRVKVSRRAHAQNVCE